MLALIFCSAGIYLLIQIGLAIGCFRIKNPQLAYNQDSHPFSLIIAAHNEEENLKKNLKNWLELDYSEYEVLVVLDRCSDESEEILKNFKAQYSHLRYLNIEELPEDWAGKKWALQKGIEASKHAFLAFTDADCELEEKYLLHLNALYTQGNEVILGQGLYKKESGFLNQFIRFETLYTAFQYLGSAKLGFPYMGVGRNLSYTKAFYLESQGLKEISSRISGDDDLLINKYARPQTTACMIGKGNRSFSEAKKDFKSWINQKLRHLSASPAYSLSSKIFLSAFHLSHTAFYLGLILFLIFDRTLCLFWASYIGRIGISWLIFLLVKKKLEDNSQLYLFPVLDLLYFIYNLSLVPIGLIQKRTAWS